MGNGRHSKNKQGADQGRARGKGKRRQAGSLGCVCGGLYPCSPPVRQLLKQPSSTLDLPGKSMHGSCRRLPPRPSPARPSSMLAPWWCGRHVGTWRDSVELFVKTALLFTRQGFGNPLSAFVELWSNNISLSVLSRIILGFIFMWRTDFFTKTKAAPRNTMRPHHCLFFLPLRPARVP